MKTIKNGVSILCALLPILLLCGVVLYALFSLFVPGPSGMYSRDSERLDIRGEKVSVRQYERLQKRLPDTHILWDVPIGPERYDSESTVIHVRELSLEDVPNFAHFENLRQVNGSRCQNYDALLALKEAYPDVDVRWAVDLAGKKLSQGCGSLRLDAGEVTAAELLEKLPLLPELTLVKLSGDMDAQSQAALMERFPEIVFDWTVSLCGETFQSTDSALSFANQPLTAEDLAAIRDNLFRFYNLEVIDLTGCGFDNRQMIEYREETGREIQWSFELCGVPVSSMDTEIDLSGQQIGLASHVEEALPCFSRLEKVIMSHCGIPDEEMDALNKRHEDVEFVWTVQIGGYELRTDTTNFIATKDPKGYIHDRHTDGFRYCTEMVALDVGHNFISDISFVECMPKLKYLILAENPVVDLSPLETLQELVFLEIFLTIPEDLTPLLSLGNLKDLNLCHTYTVKGQHAQEVLSQMTWLERLWYSGHGMNRTQETALVEALPNCELMLKRGQESVCGNWRYGEHYYDMRDALGMYYMNEWGDPVEGRQEPPFTN